MKKIKNVILNASLYTVIILILFYLFAIASDLATEGIPFGRFMLILGFSVLISIANLVFYAEKLNYLLRILIHYATLMTSFCVIFIVSGNISKAGAPAVFVAVTVFTFFYAIAFGTVYLFKRSLGTIGKAANKKNAPTSYKNLYK